MASFDRKHLTRRDFELFQNGWVTKYCKPEILRSECEWLRSRGYEVYDIDCEESGGDVLEQLKTRLGFPEYFGGNLNALKDCLSDLAIPPESGAAIVLNRFDALVGSRSAWAYELLDVLASRARFAMLFGDRLAILVQTNDPDLKFGTVAGTPVMQNGTEWREKLKFRGRVREPRSSSQDDRPRDKEES